MGLLTFIQIPCHHVLANEIALNLKYRIGLKQFLMMNALLLIKFDDDECTVANKI